MPQIDDLLRQAHERGASDLHLSPGATPMVRVNGEVVPLSPERMARDALQLMLLEIAEPDARARLDERGEIAFAYELAGRWRARCTLYQQSRGLAGALRLLPAETPSLAGLGLPEGLGALADRPCGLVLVTGPAGSGRTSTLAALVDHVNRTSCRHVVTLEEPVEFRHPCRRSLVEQREIGRHTPDLVRGLRAALQGDADVVVTGEPHGLEAMDAVLDAAAGRLVLVTLSAAGAAQAVASVLEVFPEERLARAAARLGDSLLAVLCQRLLPRADRAGRVPALERLAATDAVRAAIRERRTAQLDMLLRSTADEGTCAMDAAIAALVRDGVVAADWDRATAAAGETDAGESVDDGMGAAA